jgi:hypothetical protein
MKSSQTREDLTITVASAEVRDGNEPSTEVQHRPSQEATASGISKLLFMWLNSLFKVSKLKRREGEELVLEDLWKMPESDTTKRISETFEAGWAKAISKFDATAMSDKDLYSALVTTLWGIWGRDYKVDGLLKLVSTLCRLSMPVLLN